MRLILFITLYFLMGTVTYAQESSASELVEGIELRGFSIETTSGTITLQRIDAERATIAGDGRSTIARGVNVTIFDPKFDRRIDISAPIARYYFAGRNVDHSRPIELPPSPGDRQEIQSAIVPGAQELPSLADPVTGDLLLYAPFENERVVIQVQNEGNMRTSNLVWKEDRERFFSHGLIEQEFMSGQSVGTNEMDLFIVDRYFRDSYAGSSNVRLNRGTQ